MRLVASPESASNAERPWPRWPAGWSAIARASSVKRGVVQGFDFAGRELVLFRGDDGALRALDAFCPHMGAHLGHATIEGDGLRCALHSKLVRGGCGVQLAERFGLVFVSRVGFQAELPNVTALEAFSFTTADPVDVRVPWANFVLNGFDLPHLEAVHHRALLQPAKLVRESNCLRLEYETRVTGRAPSDLAMKWLSRNRVRARMSCFGTVGIVEADLGWTKSVLVCGVTPRTETQTDAKWPTGESRAWLSFGVPRNAFAGALRAAVTKWLYLAFLERDFAVLEKQRLTLENVDDESTLAVADFLRSREDWA